MTDIQPVNLTTTETQPDYPTTTETQLVNPMTLFQPVKLLAEEK
jgi:hypothetical protein